VSRGAKLAMRLALYALLIVGGLAVFQDDFLYYPDKAPLERVLADAQRDGLAPWPSADDYRGLRREPVGAARATVVLFHGNAGHAGHRAWYAEQLSRLGLHVILAEYPGYGPRAGKPSEGTLVADAVETLALLRRDHPGPIILAGESLGAGVAAATWAQAPDGIAALLLLTPWDKLESVAKHHYPWAPVGLVLRDRYDSAANLGAFRGRIAVVIAEHDSIVPPQFGSTLFKALPEPKRLWIIPSSDHNDWWSRADTAWWRSLVGYLLDEPPQ
jgi:pimeloyl-ACP methyl ester carboxylesterase